MKKLISAFLIVICLMGVFCLNGCYSNYTKTGIENFSETASEYGICKGLFPKELLTDYACVSSNYRYIRKGFEFTDSWEETAIVYFCYDSENYRQAKEFTMQNFEISDRFEILDRVVSESNGYVFLEINDFGFVPRNENFPKEFKRFAYNDSKQMLFFLSGYIGNPPIEEAINNWPMFLDRYYGDFYDFSK